MSRLEELQARRSKSNLKVRSDETFSMMEKITDESYRVAEVAHNAPIIIKNLDAEFESQTKLRGKDIAFLFFATALQCVRQYVLTDFKERKDNKKEAEKTIGYKQFDPHDAESERHHRLYNPSLEEIISHPAPFDLNRGGGKFGKPLAGYGSLGHRAATLEHDPILGWIFGTANIATSTVTDAKFFSYHVSSDSKNDYFKFHAKTSLVLEKTFDKLVNQGMDGKVIVGTSLLKEAVHLLSDVNSINSLPIPIVTTLNPKLGSELAEYGLDMSNILKITQQAYITKVINLLISMIHRITYNAEKDGDISLFEVRTRKIIDYSNIIASASNVLAVAIGEIIGVATNNEELQKKALRKLDVGGIAVTLYRLISDHAFISDIKQEFILNSFDKMIQGNI